jgi:RHS repeat-associated protein
VQTDRTGRFLLRLGTMPSGWQELLIDGTTANRGRRTYGIFEVAAQIVGRKTARLPYTIWMPTIDTANAVRIASPTVKETVITTPHIPGLELHLPPHTVITDHDGKIVREVSITPIPVDQPPFPLPRGVQVPIYFTIQPGGAYVAVKSYGSGRKGAWLVYPNYRSQPAGTEHQFWHYDPEEKGWHVYGMGRVSAGGQQVVPNPDVSLYEFTGAMINWGWFPGLFSGWGPFDADPVDLSTGEFVMEKPDLVVQDVIPLALIRTYRTGDDASRPFGIGTTHPYAMFLWSAHQWTEADLILPDGRGIHYVRTSGGTSWTDAVFEHTSSPTAFYKSIIVWNGNGWDLTLKDGTTYVFGPEAPLQSIRDRFGNTVTLTWSSTNLWGFGIGNIVRVTSPNARWIAFTYDGSNRITEAKDNIGRTVGYQYDGSGRVWKVTDARGGVTEYTYDIAHRMLTIKDPRGITYLDTDYDVNGRVEKQTQGDGGEFEFAYTVNGSGQVTQTDLTNPRGYVRRVAFNSDRFMTSDTSALGEAIEQTTSFTRVSTSNLVETKTDELGRVTRYTYDSKGNVATATRLYGTADAVTTTYTSDPTYSVLTSVTDPLSHTTTLAYGTQGRLQSSTNALSHQTTFATNAAGQVLSVTDPLSKVTAFGYADGDLVTVETPLGHATARFTDAAGRLISVADAQGAQTRFVYNAHDQITKITDPRGGETTFTYDGNGNLLTLTDARNKTTTWTYDDMDRVETRTDPLSRDESFAHDLNGNVTTWTDRKGQVTTYQYDALDRQTFVGFGTTGSPPTYASSVTTTYDAGDRATDIVDSLAGTIERTYDLLDRLTDEVTPEGTVSYTYDDADRRDTMTVAGQIAVSYSYDNADRLTGVTRGAASVTVAYDNASKRTSLTLPNGIVVEYAYDDDSRLTGLTYKLGMSTLGTLTYAYDANGQRTSVGGTYARTGLPAALASATYDDANQIATFGGTSFTYDDNGNLTSDGVRSYSWNVRDRLASLTGPVNGSFAYDGLGRRRSKAIGGTTTQFLYDGLNPVQELSGGTPTANLLTGLDIDEFFTRTDSAGVRNYLTDALGSSVALADGSGAVQTEYSYEPFGTATTSGTSSANSFAYTGREADGTGLYYYRARYYHPTAQRFVAEDPLGFAAGDANLHAYVGNAPTRLVDPTGEFAWAIPLGGCIGGALAFGASQGWTGRKLAKGCAIGAFLGFGAAAAGPLFGSGAAGAGAAAGAAGAGRGPANGPQIVEEIIDRASRGRDGATSRHIKEIVDGVTNSITHQVERAGEVIHQHQTHIGKYGSTRQFPDAWVNYPRIPQ